MTKAEEKAHEYGITIPTGVPGIATATPPQAQSPDGSNIQFENVRVGAAQVAQRNHLKLTEHAALIASYKAYRIDPPYPAPPPLQFYNYVAADAGGKIADSNVWPLGVPADYAFPQEKYFWTWDPLPGPPGPQS